MSFAAAGDRWALRETQVAAAVDFGSTPIALRETNPRYHEGQRQRRLPRVHEHTQRLLRQLLGA
jgi:hypothetical protein